MNEQYHIDQMILHANLFDKYGYKENEIGFIQHIEALRKNWGYKTHSETIEHAERLVEYNNALEIKTAVRAS